MPTQTPPNPILIVDDEVQSLQGVSIALRTGGIGNTLLCEDSRRVLDILAEQDVEIILLDLIMPNLSGEELLPQIVEHYPHIPVIVCTGTDELDTAIRCMKSGAFDYVLKPVSRERLISSIRHAMEVTSLRRERDHLRQHMLTRKLQNPEAFEGFDTANSAMLAICRYMESIAGSPEPVLITGETGTGKDVAAECIYRLSGAQGNFISVNVAGLDESAFSDTLFGHLKGAFTGATETRSGMIEKAAGGTLFLDEIGDLSMSLQVKLLRLLQHNEYHPLGSDLPKRSDARIIVATNRTLQSLMDPSHFRQDLFYRLRHHHIHLPPLRERRDDLPLLLNLLVERAAEKLGKTRPGIPDSLPALLAHCDFPGNIRELKALITDAMIHQQAGKLSLKPFQKCMTHTPSPDPYEAATDPTAATAQDNSLHFPPALPTLKAVQEALIDEAMARADNNQALAATMLGVSRQALNRRLNTRDK